MNSGLVLKLFSSWQLIFVCMGIMFLLPLVFYLASRKPSRKVYRPPVVRRKPARVRPSPANEPATGGKSRDEEEYKDPR